MHHILELGDLHGAGQLCLERRFSVVKMLSPLVCKILDLDPLRRDLDIFNIIQLPHLQLEANLFPLFKACARHMHADLKHFIAPLSDLWLLLLLLSCVVVVVAAARCCCCELSVVAYDICVYAFGKSVLQ